MSRVYLGFGIFVFFTAISFFIYAKNARIERLNIELDALTQSKALCETKANHLNFALLKQNEAIEAMKIDTQKSIAELSKKYELSKKKWESKISGNNASCETTLSNIIKLQELFFKERQ